MKVSIKKKEELVQVTKLKNNCQDKNIHKNFLPKISISAIKFISLLLSYWIYFHKLKMYFYFEIFHDRGTY